MADTDETERRLRERETERQDREKRNKAEGQSIDTLLAKAIQIRWQWSKAHLSPTHSAKTLRTLRWTWKSWKTLARLWPTWVTLTCWSTTPALPFSATLSATISLKRSGECCHVGDPTVQAECS